jgi:hypothetical protein
MMPFTAQPLIDRMIETQHDSKEYARLRPFYTGLSNDAFLVDAPIETAKGPSRLGRLIAFIGATGRAGQSQAAGEDAGCVGEAAA